MNRNPREVMFSKRYENHAIIIIQICETWILQNLYKNHDLNLIGLNIITKKIIKFDDKKNFFTDNYSVPIRFHRGCITKLSNGRIQYGNINLHL